MEWDEDLNRKSSEIFQIVSKELEKNLMKLFHDVPTDKNSQVVVKVTKFAPGSVVVLYTVGWLTDRDVLTSAIVRNPSPHTCSILFNDHHHTQMTSITINGIVNNYVINSLLLISFMGSNEHKNV